jgi:hypothetical protein
MEFFDLVAFDTVEEGQMKLDLFDVWQNGCPNMGAGWSLAGDCLWEAHQSRGVRGGVLPSLPG